MPTVTHPNLKMARVKGQTKYNTGKPCVRGHYSDRWTAGSTCIACEKEDDTVKPRRCRQHGIESWDVVLKMKAVQDDVCAICHKPFISEVKMHIDHCHKTSKFRGLLCQPCNQGIGFFFDDPQLLQSAAAYLERTKEN